MKKLIFLSFSSLLLLIGCNSDTQQKSNKHVENTAYPEQVFWGDTHLHTDNSTDAFGFGNRLDAKEALRFARGETVTSSKGTEAKLQRPLDFLVIADHSDGLGAIKAIYNAPRIALLRRKVLLRWYDMMHEGEDGALQVTRELIDGVAEGTLPEDLLNPEESYKRTKNLWRKHSELIEDYNQPGEFTAFLGFEYTSMPDGNNLHRVVMFRDGSDKTNTVIPFPSLGNEDPEKLWEYLAGYEKATGGKAMAMPHNSNLSNGLMFAMTKFDGSPIDKAYAEIRAKYEPIVEVTQIKGDSESHPFMSPNDEFASFGDTGWQDCNLSCAVAAKPEDNLGSYTREALKRGLEIEQSVGINPYKFGLIGSTDSHTSLATADENNFSGKHPAVEYDVKDRAIAPQNLGTRGNRFGWNYLASGYAAAWATSNTREAIFDAFARREVYATTGPRIQLRFFGGFDFVEEDLGRLVVNGYAKGVPMGGDLNKDGDLQKNNNSPTFLISALMDPESASLDRIQIIKGWLDDNNKAHEKIYNVHWSHAESRHLDKNGKLPHVDSTVDLTNGTWDNSTGESEMLSHWKDPDFNASQNAFYYVRVLEIPTPTWPVYDAIKFGVALPDDATKIQQERAYSSPIWYTP